MDDLFQIGCIGLMKAIDNFDVDLYDVRFSTYGVPMIAGGGAAFFAGFLGGAGEPVHAGYGLQRCSRPGRSSCAPICGTPRWRRSQKMLDLQREDVVFALDAISAPVSLYDPIYSDGGE